MIGSTSNGNAVLFSSSKSTSLSASKLLRIASVTAILVMFFAAFSLLAATSPLFAPLSNDSDSALFDDSGRYIMRGYDDIKPNSNFLAGLGGIWGVPMVHLTLHSLNYLPVVLHVFATNKFFLASPVGFLRE